MTSGDGDNGLISDRRDFIAAEAKAEPMREERLAGIRAAAEQYRGSLTVRNKPNGAIAHRGELLDEVDRLDGHLAAIKEAQAESVAARRKLNEIHEQEVAELRAKLAEMTRCRDNAMAYAEREHVPIELDDEIDTDGEALADRIEGELLGPGWDWEDDRTPGLLARTAVAVIRPHLARLTDQAQAARTKLNQLLEEKAAAFVDATTMFKGLTIRDGQARLEIEPAREMILIWCASVRAMLDEYQAKNYTETELEMPREPSVSLDVQDGQNPTDSYTLTLQRRWGKTPHQLRQQAERERDEARAKLAEIGEQGGADVEWAVYWVDENGEPYEKQFLQDDETEARSIVSNNHANGRGDARLWQRPAGEWREVASDGA